MISSGTGTITVAGDDGTQYGVFKVDIVNNDISQSTLGTIRLGGQDRYETSALIDKKLGVVSGEIMVAGSNDWADALSASSIAAKKGIPILLTDGETLLDSTSNFTNNNNFNKTYILGDADIISDNVANQFPNPERIGGSTEYERNINIIKRF
jgi:putative cell wall-binding protein